MDIVELLKAITKPGTLSGSYAQNPMMGIQAPTQTNAVPMSSGDLPTMTQQQPTQPDSFVQQNTKPVDVASIINSITQPGTLGASVANGQGVAEPSPVLPQDAYQKDHKLDVNTPAPQAQPQNDWLGGIVNAIPGIAKGALDFAGTPAGFKTFAALNANPYMKEALLNTGNQQQELQQAQKVRTQGILSDVLGKALDSGDTATASNIAAQLGVNLPQSAMLGKPSISQDYYTRDTQGNLKPVAIMAGKPVDPFTRQPIDSNSLVSKEQLTQQQQKDLREQALAQSKQYHEDLLDMRKQLGANAADNRINANNDKHDAHQDLLENQFANRLDKVVSMRSGGLGLQDGKVNQAIHLGTLLDQYYDTKTGQYNIPKAQYSELAIGLANLLSSTGQVTDSMRNEIITRTAKGDLNSALTYVTGTPQNGSTSDVIKNIADSIDRQGEVSEKLRDHYIDGLKKQAPTDLETKRRDNLINNNLASSYNDYKSTSPRYAAQQLSPEDQQAIAWAKSNPNDPRSAKILALHEVK